MGTKNDPGAYDCYADARPDEPMFVLLARDISASDHVRSWARTRENLIRLGQKPESDRAMVKEAYECADAMDEWRKKRRVVDDFDFEKFINQKLLWSIKTFGIDLSPHGIVDHIRRELLEIVAQPHDLKEWVDVILIALDGASRAGFTGAEIVRAMVEKMEVNRARRWTRVGDHFEHSREEEL